MQRADVAQPLRHTLRGAQHRVLAELARTRPGDRELDDGQQGGRRDGSGARQPDRGVGRRHWKRPLSRSQPSSAVTSAPTGACASSRFSAGSNQLHAAASSCARRARRPRSASSSHGRRSSAWARRYGSSRPWNEFAQRVLVAVGDAQFAPGRPGPWPARCVRPVGLWSTSPPSTTRRRVSARSRMAWPRGARPIAMEAQTCVTSALASAGAMSRAPSRSSRAASSSPSPALAKPRVCSSRACRTGSCARSGWRSARSIQQAGLGVFAQFQVQQRQAVQHQRVVGMLGQHLFEP